MFAPRTLASCVVVLFLAVVARADPPSFLNDVVPLLTRLGCNQGACHGKNAGQNGFRLSLRGYAPEWDYNWITREHHGRRLNSAVPEESVFLLKPLGVAAHEGGKLLHTSSREYQLLLDWIRAGAPGPQKTDPVVTSLTVQRLPDATRVGDRFPLSVQAEYEDGRKRDVTWLAKFDSNDPGIADVDARGWVTVRRPGETALRISFQGLVSVTTVSTPHAHPVKPEAFARRHNFIDTHVLAKLQTLRIEPSELASDSQFVRRVYLDLIGTLPTPDEVRAFVNSPHGDYRERLVDDLMKRPEFADYWALFLGDLFQNRKERDHDVRGTKGVRAFHAWLRQQVEQNRPWDALCRDLLTATGPTTQNPAVGYYVVTVGEQREADRSEVVASVAQAFLGVRIGCAQCHNHPLERYTQDDYYHFAAFFSRMRLDRKDPKVGPTTLLVGHRDANQNSRPVGVNQPRTGQFMKPQPLDRSTPDIKPGDDPRVALAAWITDPSNEYFTGAIVNRLWAHFLGVGLVEPIDDLRASNPPSNPELWKALLADFVESKFDLRRLMKQIVLSRTYQSSSSTTAANSQDARLGSHYIARRLPAEVLLDAISQATGVPERFAGYPEGIRAIQVPDPTAKSYFLSAFGRSERVTACACERSGDVTLTHTLHLINGGSTVGKLQSSDGRLRKLLKSSKTDDEIIDELFLVTLSRTPKEVERRQIEPHRKKATSREVFFEDLFWALLNSKEFIFNH